jgi:hypothetical protein
MVAHPVNSHEWHKAKDAIIAKSLNAVVDDLELRFSRDERLAIAATLLLPFLAEEPLFGRQLPINGDEQSDGTHLPRGRA